ncbi:protein quiver [Contarinia nasturtii]|uniref:protein quiver n=1 Tax=Contarinia nasturtii TaxID=265458 RepID=UPI0012D40C07|nr:protein quiver [Contarinia nasturtii]
MLKKFIYLSAVIFIISLDITEGALRRCYQCRSRGELGSCKDPFKYNVTQIDNEHGITAVPCASGWCGKVIESQGTLRDDDYDMATQRMCVQRGPSDSEDRCAHTTYNYKKVYMCFCQGDLCNTAADKFVPNFIKLALISTTVVLWSLMQI